MRCEDDFSPRRNKALIRIKLHSELHLSELNFGPFIFQASGSQRQFVAFGTNRFFVIYTARSSKPGDKHVNVLAICHDAYVQHEQNYFLHQLESGINRN